MHQKIPFRQQNQGLEGWVIAQYWVDIKIMRPAGKSIYISGAEVQARLLAWKLVLAKCFNLAQLVPLDFIKQWQHHACRFHQFGV